MNMEMLIEELQDIADNAFTIPLSGGKTVVNAERLKDIIDEMKENIPQEIKQAKSIVADRNNILSSAKERVNLTRKEINTPEQLIKNGYIQEIWRANS